MYVIRGGSYDLLPRQEIAVGIWWILAAGFAAGVLPRAKPTLGLAPVAALLLLGAWTALSLIWTQSDERTVAEAARVVGFLGLMLGVDI